MRHSAPRTDRGRHGAGRMTRGRCPGRQLRTVRLPCSNSNLPYKIHTVLTDNGTHFTTPDNVCSAAQEIKECLARGEIVWAHAFERACDTNDIDHRLTKPKHPWTNGQVEQ